MLATTKFATRLWFQLPHVLSTLQPRSVTTAANTEIDTALNSAWAANTQGDFALSAQAFQRAATLQTTELGPLHEDTLLSKNNLGAALLNSGQLDEAEPILRATLLERINVLGDDNAATLTTANNLGILLKQTNQLEEAEAISKRAFVGSLTAMGPVHEDVLDTAQNYGEILMMVGKYEKCESLFLQMQTQCERTFGLSHPNTQQFMNNLAIIKQMKEKLK